MNDKVHAHGPYIPWLICATFAKDTGIETKFLSDPRIWGSEITPIFIASSGCPVSSGVDVIRYLPADHHRQVGGGGETDTHSH